MQFWCTFRQQYHRGKMGTSETLVSTERAEYARKPTLQASGYNMLRAIRMEKGWSKIQIHWLSGSLHAPPHAANTVAPIRGMTFSHLSFNFLGGSPKAQLQQRVQMGRKYRSTIPTSKKRNAYQLNENSSNFLWFFCMLSIFSIQVTWGFVTGFPLTLNTRSPSNKMPSHPPPSQGAEGKFLRVVCVYIYIYTYIYIYI